MLAAVLTIAGLATAFGLILGYSAQRFRVEGDPIADQVDALLPQTQCGQCGYPGCRPYAEAIAGNQADINHCPPGGEATVLALADLLGRDPKPLEAEVREKAVAVIDENTCIGCTLCIQACPVDAIVGAAKQMHTVIESECTGCELCLEPCPVDCVEMVPVHRDIRDWRWAQPPPSPIEAPRPSRRPADAGGESA
ncbi:Electron transport complex protein RnfB [Thioalkalivibrio nitratireducens DSM 14787]|uniref:Ion-translocating oxidoreductase complex subunit B n=1 Tax=Thioalkalivibrio nitratireducens (strain DSM 14787 / UNIQEM 213 / ALEN2) TaxID=1255043 RepID=L0DYA3_THIND|nr:electron transport complex subunit RsxB [Thioalkalivibrio nitratireducens]AGA34023.1 Electron transport complex protein RnfB [Thioalkalivibrio nitratireducens DSM 14787]